MTIGKRIKQIREEKGLTQTALAKAVGIAPQTVFKYEKDILTDVPLNKIEKMAAALGISPARLVGWEEISPEEVLLTRYRRLNQLGREQLDNCLNELIIDKKYTI